mmetsp:Transcript_64524/g.114710  ORF Transcript_64524/g.114710 Transcript_64524/m.114710 type:complete len:743 (+) Transcript_64524:82-2310(+)
MEQEQRGEDIRPRSVSFGEEVPDEETEPLLRPTQNPPIRASSQMLPQACRVRDMRHEPTIYSFMLFQPELSRMSRGHYWTPPVVLAFILLILNVTMQLALSWIAGAHITWQHNFFTDTLLNFGTTFTGGTPEALAGDWLTQQFSEAKAAIFGKEISDDTCCNAAECSEMGLVCCDRTGANPHRPNRPILAKIGSIPGISVDHRKSRSEDSQDISPAPAPAAAPSAAPAASSFLAFTKPGGGGKKGRDGDDGGPVLTKSGAVCHHRNGTLDCSPDSFAFIESWSDLDRDGDGLWTLEEARADEANLGCKLGMSVEEIFRSVSRGVVKDAKDTAGNSYAVPFVPFSLEQRHAIPKTYFEWWRGLVAFCIVADGARCGELVQKGIFDGVIGAPDPKSHRGGVVDMDTAIDYCQRLLSSGGICEQTLPGTYMMYRSKLMDKCGDATYQLGERLTNPHDERDAMHTIKVTYLNEKVYRTCSGGVYTFFLSLVLFLWYTNLAGEAYSCVCLLDFLVNFPRASAGAGEQALIRPIKKLIRRTRKFGPTASLGLSNSSLFTPKSDAGEESASDEDKGYKPASRVESLTPEHQCTCWIMLAMRLWLLVWMFRVGATYLLYTKTYEDLLLNSVALGFIFDLPAFLYNFLVNGSIKAAIDEAKTIPYRTSLPDPESWKHAFINKSVWGISVIPLMVFIQVLYNRHSNILPSAEALLCACHQEGENCLATHVLQKWWWDNYWEKFGIVQSSPFG